MEPGGRFTEALACIRQRAENSHLTTIQDLVELVGPRGHGFLTLFLVLPFMQPIPLVGISTPIGLTIALLGLWMALDRPPGVPRRLGRVVVESRTILRICSAIEKLMRKLERVVKPRRSGLFEVRMFRLINGSLVLINGVLLSLPLPIPFSNFLPAVALLLLSLGTLEEDSLTIGVGYVAALATAVFFTALVVLPYLGIQLLNSQ